MDMALCNSCGKYVSLGRANGTVYGSTRLIGYRPDGEPVIYPIWRIDCYGGCVRTTAAAYVLDHQSPGDAQ